MKFVIRGYSETVSHYECKIEIEAETEVAAIAAAAELDRQGQLPWIDANHDDGPSEFEATAAK